MPSRQRSMRSKTSRRGLNKETGSIASIGSKGTAQRADTILAAKPPPTPLNPQNPSNLISREVSYPFMMEAWNKESEMRGALQSLLIMEGGAMRGLFTAGVLDAFMEEELYFPCSMGISAGSMQGLCYLAHQRGRSLRMNTRFAKDSRYMGLRHLVKRGSYFNFHFIFGELSESIDPYDFLAAEKAEETLYIIMTDAFTGKPVYVSSRSCTVREFFKISEASCSIPLFSKPVPLKDGVYVDGGIGMPFVPLPEELPAPCRKPVYILTRDRNYRKKPVPAGFHALLSLLYGKDYPRVVREMCAIPAIYNEKVEKLLSLEKEGRVFVIRPKKPVVVSRTEKDVEKLRALHKEGYEAGLACHEDLMRWLHET